MRELIKALLIAASVFYSGFTAAEYCDLSLSFETEPKYSSQIVDVHEGKKLKLKRWVAIQTIAASSARRATNVTCQTIDGVVYSGGTEEWKQFIESAAKGLSQANAKDIRFTLIGSDEALYHGKLEHLEYRFDAVIGDHEQVIKNITLIERDRNEVITVSVSGSKLVEEEIISEYQRVIELFSRH
ncbi:hypothetical protein ACFOEE_11210 [Pseudoalteromonas fenneropenaei]|uniref:Uncharacterized protein n=1 Tax=Pseudoalteromonas fenneropenaei TaxID=1737459 RepID=A0ABV7CKL7_9GAMM